jgi:hypothetical protein
LITADLRRSYVKADRSIDSSDATARATAPRTQPPAVFIPKLDAACACCSHHTPLSPPTDHEILGKTEPTVQKFFGEKTKLQTFVDKAEMRARYRYLKDAWGWALTTL